MGELYEATHETVHLAVRDGCELVYLEKLHARRRSLAPSRVGGRMPLHSSALGKAILAGSDPETVEAVLSLPLKPLTPHTVTRPRDLCTELSAVSRSGYSFDRNETAPGLSCVAAPIFRTDSSVAGALSVAGPSRGSFRPERLAALVKVAARGVGQALN
jgi:DNA-binding IclR family transcriptional regulator